MNTLFKVIAIILALHTLVACSTEEKAPVVELDTDGDGTPDVTDLDDDGDGYADTEDKFPLDINEWADLDNDSIGDNSDKDIDGDGITNVDDVFPLDATESSDLDSDGVGDNSDPDRDGDGALNVDDAFPDDPSETLDTDGDGTGDNADTDANGNGIEDIIENYEQEIFDLPATINGVTDVVYHEQNNQFFMAQKANKSVVVIDADTGDVQKTFTFDYMAERVELSHDKSTLYVTLLTQEHSSYWWEEEQEGRIAVIDVDTLEVTSTHLLNIDPFDIVLTKDNLLVVSSGSGQWTNINVYNANSGNLVSQSHIRQMSNLSYSSDKNWVIAANTDQSPSDFEKFTVTTSSITAEGDSPYHGDYSILDKAWINKAGTSIITRGGDAFDAANMEYRHTITSNNNSIESILFDDANDVVFLGLSNSTLVTLNQTSLVQISSTTLFGKIIAIANKGYFSYSIVESGGIYSITKNLHPCLSCSENTAPTATFVTTPADSTNSMSFVFDASSSTDSESPTELKYRWDFESDGIWDTPFSDSATYEYKFFVKGTKYIRLQVSDREGKVSSVTKTLVVEQGIEDAIEISDSVANSLSFDIDYIKLTTANGQGVFLDKQNKRIYFTDLTTGFTTKYFEFSLFPTNITIDANNRYLYVNLSETLQYDYWSVDDTKNYIAVIDIELAQWINTLAIDFRPHSIAASNDGRIFATGSNYDHSSVFEISSENGEVLKSIWFDSHINLFISDDDDYLFAVDNSSTWVELMKIDLQNGKFSELERTTIRLENYSDTFWLSNNGEYFVTNTGQIINTKTFELKGSLDLAANTAQQILFDDDQNLIFVLDYDGKVRYYNQQSLFLVDSFDVPILTTRLFLVGDELLLLIEFDGEDASIIRNTHPCLTCGDNTAPSASFTITPDNNAGSTADIFSFDSSASTDLEDLDGLLYRWDAEGDGDFETHFTDSPLYTHQYVLKGSYSPTLQVKDHGGLVATYSIDIEVKQGEISPTTIADSTPYFLDFTITDAKIDATRDKIYFTDKDDYKLYIYDITSGETQSVFEFDYKPEFMAISPDSSKLYISLLKQEHSYNWYDDDQEGYIAVIELDDLIWNDVLYVNIDPYAIAASDEYLYLSSGSGQWTKLAAYHLASDTLTTFNTQVYQQSQINYDTQNDILYVFGSNEIDAYEHQGNELSLLKQTSFYDNLRSTKQAWLSTDGTRFITRGGQVISTGNLTVEIDSLISTDHIKHVTFDPTNNVFFVLTEDDKFEYYNAISFEHIAHFDDVEQAYLAYVYSDKLIVISGEEGAFSVDFVDHPCPTCGTNTAPVAEFEVISTDPSTGSEIQFDAALSSDLEDGMVLLYRWDFDSDGVWDTEFTDDLTASTLFTIKGEKSIRLQVKDSGGLVDEFVTKIDVIQGTNYGTEVTNSFAYILETEIEDLYLDNSRGKLYISDRSAKKLFVVDMATGLTERFFAFNMDIGAITVTPDESTMYVALLSDNTRSCCWWEEDQFGYIATFDLATLGWNNTYEVAIDPYDMVATDDGNLIISSGSGQWTHIKNFDASNGNELDKAGIYHRSNIELHPDQDKVYAADTALSPSDIELFSISSTSITSEGDSPYHGDHRFGGYVWVMPQSDKLITRGGDIFNASDMTFYTSIELSYSSIYSIAFNDTTMTITTGYDGIFQYSLKDYSLINSTTNLESYFIFNYEDKTFYVDDNGQGVEFKELIFD